MAKDDLGNQLSVQQQINKVLQQRTALQAQQTKVLGAQVKIAAELCKALDCKGLDGMNDRLREINDSLNTVAETAEEAAGEVDRLGEAAEGAAEGSSNLTSNMMKLGGGIGLLKGVSAGFAGIWSTLKGLGKGIMTVIGSVFKLGKTILTVPLKIWQGLIGMAQGGGGGPNPIKVALEEVRKEMGALNKNEGAGFKSSLKAMRKESKNLAGTALSVSKVFGRGPGGFAEMLKYNLETAKALGSAMSALSSEFSGKSAVALAMYRKGLGLTGEEMAEVGRMALMNGKSMKEQSREIASYAIQMGKDFGINSKLISKDMGKMMADFDNFGGLGAKVMSQLSVYTRKLGIEIKALTGLVDKWDNFEDAAKGAAQLAQNFGMNINAMEMMKTQDPGKRLAMMQKAFAKTGKSIESMDRQSQKQLATLTGLDRKSVSLAFSQRGLGMSYDDIQKAGDKNEKKQLTQAEAMSKLADSIERVFGGGGGSKFKGFFDAFAKGFGKGIKKSKEMRAVFRNIRKSLRVVYKAGKRVGKAFVKMFPGIKKMLGGLKKLFDPRDMKKLMDKVVKEFKNFFKIVKDDPQAGVSKLFEKLKKIFKDFFGSKGSAAKEVKEGGSVFLKTMWGIFKGLLMIVIPLITKGVKKLTEIIANPAPITSALSEVFSELWSALGGLFGEIFSKLGPPLWKAIKGLFAVIWEKLKPYVMKAMPFLIGGLLLKGLMVAVLSMLKGGALGGILGLLGSGIMKLMGKVVKKQSKERAAKQMGASLTAPFRGAIQSMRSVKSTDIMKGAGKIFLLATVFLPAFIMLVVMMVAGLVGAIASMGNPLKFAVGMYGISLAIGSFRSIFTAATLIEESQVMKSIGKALLLTAFIAVGLIGLTYALLTVGSIARGADWGTIALALVSISLGVAAMSLVVWAASKTDASQAANAQKNIVGMIPVLGATTLFGLAMFIAAPVLSSMVGADLFIAAIAILGIAAIIASLGLAAKAAKFLDASASTVASANMTAALPFLAMFMVFSIILGIVATIVGEGVDWKKTALMVLATALAIGAVAGVIWAATLIQPGLAVPALIGLALGIAFIFVLAYTLIPALKDFGKQKIEFMKIGKNMLKLIPIMFGILVIAMLSMIVGPFALLGVVGLYPAGWFINALAETLIPALAKMVADPKVSEMNWEKVNKIFCALQGVMKVLGMVAYAALFLAPFAFIPFFGGESLINKLVEPVGWFLSAMAKKMMPGVKEIDEAFTITDPEGFKSKMEGIAAIMTALGPITEAAARLGEVEVDAIDEGATFSVLDKVKGVLQAIFLGISGPQGILASVIKLSENVSPSQVKMVTAIGEVLSAIGNLIGNIVPPISDMAQMALEMSEQGGWLISSTNTCKFKKIMGEISTFVEETMKTIKNCVGPMITAIMEIDVPIDSVRTKNKIAIIASVIDVLGKVSGMFAEQGKVLMDMNKGTQKSHLFGLVKTQESTRETMRALSSLMSNMMFELRMNIPPLVRSMVGILELPALKGDPKAAKDKAETIAALMSSVADAVALIQEATKMIGQQQRGKRPLATSIILRRMKTAASILPAIGGKIKEAVDAMLKIDIPKTDEEFVRKMKNLSSAVKIIGDAGNVVVGLITKLPNELPIESLNKLARKWFGKGKSSVLNMVFSGIRHSLPKLMETIREIISDPAMSGITTGSIEKVSEMIKILGVFGKVMTQFMEMTGDFKEMDGKQLSIRAKWIFQKGNRAEDRSVMETVARGMAAHFPTILGPLKAAATDPALQGVNIAHVKKLAEMVKIVGTFASVIKDMMTLMPKQGEAGAQTIASRAKWIFQDNVKGEESLLETIAKGISRHFPVILTAISKAVKSMSDKSITSSRVKLLGDIIKVVATFATVIKDMMTIMPDTKGLTGKQIMQKARWMFEKDTSTPGTSGGKSVLSVIANGLKDNLPIVVRAITGLFSGDGALKNTYGMAGKVKLLTNIFKAIAVFVKAITEIQTLDTTNKNGKTIQKKLEDIADLFEPFEVDGIHGTKAGGGGMTKIVDALAGFGTKITPAQLKNMSKGAYRLGRMAYAIRMARSLVLAAMTTKGKKSDDDRTMRVTKENVDIIATAIETIAAKDLGAKLNSIGGGGAKAVTDDVIKRLANLRVGLVYLNKVIKALPTDSGLLGRWGNTTADKLAYWGVKMPIASGIKDFTKEAVQGARNLRDTIKPLDAAVTQLAASKGILDMATVDTVVESVGRFGDMLHGVSGVAGFEVVKAMKGGSLEIKHNIGRAKVEVVVNLGKSEVAREIASATFDNKKLSTEPSTAPSTP